MQFETKRIFYAAFFPALLILLIWMMMGIEWSFDFEWYRLGIFPRRESGLLGILTSPLVHLNFKHLYSNTISLFVLNWCLFYFYKDLAYLVFPLIWIFSGLITWCIARESWHIGASGLIYGLSFFLFFSGVFRKYIPLLATSMLVVFLYGSTLWNMFPISEWIDSSVSWEGHLAGAIGGIICAVIFRKYGPQKPDPFPEDESESNEINENDEENRGNDGYNISGCYT
ncbi:MAG: rhomboid family intramembrane serine protease [Dysgonamonadaceae bacterium]|jgi:membrane associated rhomboid family serine protease|nr:rhomboid family intramembrane serine protease [Dysgonamonadaceae bacterium]